MDPYFLQSVVAHIINERGRLIVRQPSGHDDETILGIKTPDGSRFLQPTSRLREVTKAEYLEQVAWVHQHYPQHCGPPRELEGFRYYEVHFD